LDVVDLGESTIWITS